MIWIRGSAYFCGSGSGSQNLADTTDPDQDPDLKHWLEPSVRTINTPSKRYLYCVDRRPDLNLSVEDTEPGLDPLHIAACKGQVQLGTILIFI